MVQAGIDGMRGEPGALALMVRAVELDGQTQHSHVLRQSSHLMGFFLWRADRFEEFRASVEQLYERAVSQGDESSVPRFYTAVHRRDSVRQSRGGEAAFGGGRRDLAGGGRAVIYGSSRSMRGSAGCSASLIGRATLANGRSRSLRKSAGTGPGSGRSAPLDS